MNTKDEEELELRDQARFHMRMLVKVGQQWLLGKVGMLVGVEVVREGMRGLMTMW